MSSPLVEKKLKKLEYKKEEKRDKKTEIRKKWLLHTYIPPATQYYSSAYNTSQDIITGVILC